MSGILAQIKIGGAPLALVGDSAFRLTRKLRESLARELVAHCLWATARGETLFVVTDSAAWAARFRFEQGRLLETAATETGSRLREFRVIVAPPSSGGPFGSF